jgi:phage/plasmid-like protein (TIGR03299 family)
MAAHVETAAYADQAAWHGVGTVVKGAMSTAEVAQLAGIDWEVELRKVYTSVAGRYVPLSDDDPCGARYVVTRKTDGRRLGVVGRRYQPIQNTQAISFLDEVIAMGGLEWEAAGSLYYGAKIWALVRTPEVITIGGKGDETYPYLLITTAHDGSSRAKVLPTAIRVVCNNTLRAALWQGDKDLTVEIPHLGNIQNKVAAARQILGISVDLFKLYGTAMNQLADVDGLPLVRPLLDALFPQREIAYNDDGSMKENKRRQAKVDGILELYGKQEQSGWGLLNAVTEWVDHVYAPHSVRDTRSRTKADGVMELAFMDRGADLKSDAASSLLTMAGIYERMQVDLDALKVRVRQGIK